MMSYAIRPIKKTNRYFPVDKQSFDNTLQLKGNTFIVECTMYVFLFDLKCNPLLMPSWAVFGQTLMVHWLFSKSYYSYFSVSSQILVQQTYVCMYVVGNTDCILITMQVGRGSQRLVSVLNTLLGSITCTSSLTLDG